MNQDAIYSGGRHSQVHENPAYVQEMFRDALLARSNSYSPYSGHQVGACILTSSGKRFSGCNVENASYGGTCCAERVALFKAVSELGGKVQIRAMMVLTASPNPWPPCGLCAQILAEFSEPDSEVLRVNLEGQLISAPFQKLFPCLFIGKHLEMGKSEKKPV